MTRILMIEDHAETARIVVALLALSDPFTVSIAANAAEARRSLEEQQPDVILLDLGLPDQHGAEFLRRLRASRSRIPVIVLTSITTQASIVEALEAGANGYLFKDDLARRLPDAIHEVLRGDAPLSSGAAAKLLELMRQGKDGAPSLTHKESAVLEQLSTGASYEQIGEDLGILLNTVRTHIRALYEKLGVQNRAEAVNLAWRLGLLPRHRV